MYYVQSCIHVRTRIPDAFVSTPPSTFDSAPLASDTPSPFLLAPTDTDILSLFTRPRPLPRPTFSLVPLPPTLGCVTSLPASAGVALGSGGSGAVWVEGWGFVVAETVGVVTRPAKKQFNHQFYHNYATNTSFLSCKIPYVTKRNILCKWSLRLDEIVITCPSGRLLYYWKEVRHRISA